MSFITIIGIAFGLAMDAFAVSIAVSASLKGVSRSQTLRLSFYFGLFQFLMPVIGYFAGISVARFISAYDHWVALSLLTFIGGRMVIGSFGEDREIKAGEDPTRGITLIVLSIATSIDALAVGLSFAMLKVNVWYPSAIIGVVAFAMTSLGMNIGSRLGAKFGHRMELVGGIVLIGIGIKILIEHSF